MTHALRRWLTPAMIGSLLTFAAPAAAQGSRAEELFREGRAAMDAGDVVQACAKFEESLSLEASLGPLLNLADCEEKRGRLVRAVVLWREGLAKLPADDGRRDLATRRVADLERRIPKIVVSADPGASILIDSDVAQAGVPHPADPGKHEIVISGAGPSRTLQVSVVEGQALAVDGRAGAAEPAPGAPPPSSPPEDAGEGPSLAPAIVAYGVGGAGLVVFGVTGALWLGEKSTVDDQCPDRRCTPEGLEAGDSGQTLGIVNAIGLGTFVAGAALGTILLVTASSGDDEAASAPRATLAVTPGGARISGAF